MLMGGTGLRWMGMAATVAIAVCGMAAASSGEPAAASGGVPTAAAGAPIAAAGIIPAPAHVESRPGAFVISADTPLSIPSDPRGARAARYFAEVLQKTRGMQLATESGAGRRTAHSIVFRLDAQAQTEPE